LIAQAMTYFFGADPAVVQEAHGAVEQALRSIRQKARRRRCSRRDGALFQLQGGGMLE